MLNSSLPIKFRMPFQFWMINGLQGSAKALAGSAAGRPRQNVKGRDPAINRLGRQPRLF